MNAGKGSLAASLFFLSLVFASIGSVLGSVTPWALSVLAMALAGWAGAASRLAESSLSLAVLGFGLLVALNALLSSPAYTPAGLYHPLLLAVGFLAARRFVDHAMKGAAFAALGFGVFLAIWGLAQIGPLGVTRAHALFETPATYAAALNLLLLPVLAAALVGRRGALLLAAGGLLAAGLFAADSRGGLLALAAGIGAVTILGRRSGLLQRRGLGIVLALLAAGWIVAAVVRTLPAADSTVTSMEARAQSSLSRLELYALSWNAWLERPLAGTGYLTFRYTLEQGRAQVPSYGESNETWFVHNDYLQTLQELGPLGLVALLALAWLPALVAYRRIPALRADLQPAAIAATSALTAMACHALVDFPFYIPVCLLLYGALLGGLDRQLNERRVALAPNWRLRPWYRAAQTGIVLVAGLVLVRPVVAEAAAEWGLRQSAAGNGPSAAFWIGAARRIDPADWRYHWYAGQFWDAQAADAGKREAAWLAADAYAAGFDANPLEVTNLLGKISVHRRYRNLLDAPADRSTLQAWLTQAEALAPLNREVHRERELLGAPQ